MIINLTLVFILVLLLGGSFAFCHPTAVPELIRRPFLDKLGEPPAGTPALEMGQAHVMFDLYTAMVAHAPTPAQDDIQAAAFLLFKYTQKWPDAISGERASFMVQKLNEHLLQEYLHLHVIWTDQGPQWQDGHLHAMALSKGLTRHIMLVVENRSRDSIQIQPKLAGVTSINVADGWSAQNGGQFRFLLPVTATVLSAKKLPLELNKLNDAKSTPVLDIPVEVTEPAILKGVCIDARNRKPFPARVYALGSDAAFGAGEAYKAVDTISEKQQLEYMMNFWKTYRLPFFYTDGHFEVLLPAGEAVITMERGFESMPVNRKITLKPGKVHEITLAGDELIDLKKMGWYGGDTHVHWAKNYWSENEDIELLKLVQRAEGLRVVNNLTLYQYRSGKDGGPFTKPDQHPIGPVPGCASGDFITWMAEEYRNDSQYGHVNMLNIKKMIQPIATGKGSGGPEGTPDWPLSKSVLEECHRQGGINIDAHGLGPMGFNDIPANVIMGLTDALDQIEPEDYYRFLNSGVRIGLGNGSDHPARVAGSLRCYVKVEGRLSYQKWVDGLKAGRSFATSGPLLFLTVNGKEPGQVIDVRPGQKLNIAAKAISRFRVGSLQIIRNGSVLAEKTIITNRGELSLVVPVEGSAWFAARCSDTPGTWFMLNSYNIAHTSAVYTPVDKKPVLQVQAIEHWIEYLNLHMERIRSQAVYKEAWQREEQVAYLKQALRRYEELKPLAQKSK